MSDALSQLSTSVLPINITKPTEMFEIACWVFQGDNGAILCESMGRCKRPDNDPTACFGCYVAYRMRGGMVEYYRQPVSLQGSA